MRHGWQAPGVCVRACKQHTCMGLPAAHAARVLPCRRAPHLILTPALILPTAQSAPPDFNPSPCPHHLLAPCGCYPAGACPPVLHGRPRAFHAPLACPAFGQASLQGVSLSPRIGQRLLLLMVPRMKGGHNPTAFTTVCAVWALRVLKGPFKIGRSTRQLPSQWPVWPGHCEY